MMRKERYLSGIVTAIDSCAQPQPTRTIICGDAFDFLQKPLPSHAALITSLPDISEVPGLDNWQQWFIDAAIACCRAVADESVAIFYQTDIKRAGVWVDKSYLVMRAAEAAGAALLWHKIVCRVAPGTTTFGRPAYSHMLSVSRKLRVSPAHATPDVLPELGHMPWVRAMGQAACTAAVTFARIHAHATTIVDPFCGYGTVLAVANDMGLDGIGVELSRRRAKKAQRLQLGTSWRHAPELGTDASGGEARAKP